jgi:3-oxoacyl-[acyl-carrier-protein] synthase III
MKNPKFKIISTGKYLPKHKVHNDEMKQYVDTSDEWIYTRTGISYRRYAKDEVASDMATKAAIDAIEKVNYDQNKIDLIVVATITGDQMTPSTANFVQGKLGLTHDVMSFDINAACTGFMYGLEVAASLLETNKFRAALVIGTEKLSQVIDFTDRNTCVLFGDGAGAMIIEPSQHESDQHFFYNASKSDLNDTLTVKKYIHMDGKKVYLFAIDVMEKSIQKILIEANMTIDDIDKVIPHQANVRIIQSVAKSMDIPIEKMMINLGEYGNTSAASIPITVAEYMEQNESKGKNILLVGFGGGFTWGSAILKL